MTNLNAERIFEIFKDCLYAPSELPENFDPKKGVPPPGAIMVEGITHKFAFHPEKIKRHRHEVKDFLAQLPAEFNQDTGGGWSFLQACIDRDGRQWGEHANMEQLFCLGIGLGMVESLLPRDQWAILPGGVPYYMIKRNYGEEAETV